MGRPSACGNLDADCRPIRAFRPLGQRTPARLGNLLFSHCNIAMVTRWRSRAQFWCATTFATPGWEDIGTVELEQVISLVAETFGETPLHASRMAFGHNSVTFDVALPGRNVIVRTNTRTAVFAH